MNKLMEKNTAKESKLMRRWLGAVNQPVVDYANEQLASLLGELSDWGNFNLEECKQILTELLQGQSQELFDQWLKRRDELND